MGRPLYLLDPFNSIIGIGTAIIAVAVMIVAGFYAVRAKMAERAQETADVWERNARAYKEERDRLEETLTGVKVEMSELKKQAPGLMEIAKRMDEQVRIMSSVAKVISRVDQSLQLLVRDQGERRRRYRPPDDDSK